MQTPVESNRLAAKGYCPICTHLVDLIVEKVPGRYVEKLVPVPGQRCRRCSTSIGSAYIVEVLGPAPDFVGGRSESEVTLREFEAAPPVIVEAAAQRRGRARQ